MNVVLSGYGKMGREVEAVLREKGITPLLITEDVQSVAAETASRSVCIDFTQPAAFIENYRFIAEHFPYSVIGTTGWNSKKDEILNCFRNLNSSMIYASNFSIGVNIFFKLNEIAAKLTSSFKGYDPYVLEMHHVLKLDSPSGTAKTTAEVIGKSFGKNPEISAVRAGSVPGIHQAGYESDLDRINIIHESFSRRGFANGAVLAAEWIYNYPGVHEFRDLLENNFNKIIGIC